MQLILGLFLVATTASAIAQQQSIASGVPVLPNDQRPSPELTSPETSTTSAAGGAASLPDAPSYTTRQPSIDASEHQPERTAGVTANSYTVGSATMPQPPVSKPFLDLAMPNRIGNSSLIFTGGKSAAIEAPGAHQQSDGGVSSSGKNCSSSLFDKTDGSGWMTSLLSMASKGERYCTLGEGGFWKRGTYAWSSAFVAHRYGGANSFNTSGFSVPSLASGFPAGSSPYQSYAYQYDAGQRMATRYATAVGRDAVKNMLREFWPDISTRVLRRHP